jgi:hypothetical protein
MAADLNPISYMVFAEVYSSPGVFNYGEEKK